MNVSSIIGILISLVVFGTALATTSNNFRIFLDLHAILIVVGGTFAAGFVCFSVPRVLGLMQVFLKRVLGVSKRDYNALIADISRLSQAARKGGSLEPTVAALRDPFLKDSAQLLDWKEMEIPQDQLRDLLETRAETNFVRHMDDAAIFATLAKFPPAFGLMGTTLGMIALLQSLGAEGSKNAIGPSMSVALVATLYGVVLANFVFIPISEQLKKQSKEDALARCMIVEGVLMIADGLPTRFVEERMKSYLLPHERAQGDAGGSARQMMQEAA